MTMFESMVVLGAKLHGVASAGNGAASVKAFGVAFTAEWARSLGPVMLTQMFSVSQTSSSSPHLHTFCGFCHSRGLKLTPCCCSPHLVNKTGFRPVTLQQQSCPSDLLKSAQCAKS